MILFIIGVVEMFIVAYWTKTVVESRVYMSGAVTIVNILIWYYVLQTFVEDINNWYLIISYALGCAVGTMLSGYVSNLETKRRGKKKEMAITQLEPKALVTK